MNQRLTNIVSIAAEGNIVAANVSAHTTLTIVTSVYMQTILAPHHHRTSNNLLATTPLKSWTKRPDRSMGSRWSPMGEKWESPVRNEVPSC